MKRLRIYILFLLAIPFSALTADQPPLDEVQALISAAKTKGFQAITDIRMSAAKKDASASLKALDRYLKRGGTDIETGWKKYLGWDELTSQVNADQPDLQSLGNRIRRFFNGHKGLERPHFVNARKAVNRYYLLQSLKANPEAANNLYSDRLVELSESVQVLAKNSDAIASAQATSTLELLESIGQAPELIQTMRNSFAQPNIVFGIHESAVNSAISEPVDEVRKISEPVLKTYVTGRARTTGTLTANVVPNEEHAQIEIHLKGTSSSKTVGVQKPVKIFSNGKTSISARVTVQLNGSDINPSRAQACCSTHTHIRNICSMSKFGKKLIQKIAWKKAGQQKGKAERIVSRRAERRVAKKMNVRIQDAVADANQRMDDKIRIPATQRNVYPRSVKLSSTDEWVNGVAIQGQPGQLVAPSNPPSMPDHQIKMQVHESTVVNSAINYASGLVLTDQLAQEFAKDITGEVPESLQIQEDEDRWSMIFDRLAPVVLRFRDGKLGITIRTRRFSRGDDAINRLMEITANYQLSIQNHRLMLVRDGDIEVTYPSKEGQLNIEDISYRNFIRNKFGSLFEQEIPGEGIELPETLAKMGTMELNFVDSQNGWISLGWDFSQSDDKAEQLASIPKK